MLRYIGWFISGAVVTATFQTSVLVFASASTSYSAIGAIAVSLFYLTFLPGVQAFFQLEHSGVIPRGDDDDFIREMFARGCSAVGWGLISALAAWIRRPHELALDHSQGNP
jgi:hypothetical protein